MKFSRVVCTLVSLFLLGCGGGGGDNDFTWEGGWTAQKDTFKVTNDCVSCGASLIEQFPDVNVFQEEDRLEITFCSGVRCTAISGRFNSEALQSLTPQTFTAEGEFGVVSCPEDLSFIGNFTTLTLEKVNNNKATLRVEAIEQTLTGSCGISVQGTINRE